MNLMVLKENMLDKKGRILLKADRAYIPEYEEFINGKRYLVYNSEIEDKEVLIPVD